MGKLRSIEKDWFMVTQGIQDRLLIIPSAPYIAVASFGPGKGLNVVGDPAPVRRRTEKGQEEGLDDSIQGVTELPLFQPGPDILANSPIRLQKQAGWR